MLADFMTIKEKFGHLKGLTLAYVGDGRDNVADSLLVAGSMLGVNVHIVTPKLYSLTLMYKKLQKVLPKILDQEI